MDIKGSNEGTALGMMDGRGKFIYVPINRQVDELIEVSCEKLPGSEDVLNLLRGEIAPLDVWQKFAVEYYRQGRFEDFKTIMKAGTDDDDLEEYYSDERKGRIALLNILAAYYINRGRELLTLTSRREKLFSKAESLLDRADRIEPLEETYITKGTLQLARGEFSGALESFSTVLTDAGDQLETLPAIIGQAVVFFQQNKYKESLRLFRAALSKAKCCPPSVRLGIGLCLSRLNQPTLAMKAFDRVLELDPGNPDALISKAVLLINQSQVGKGNDTLKDMDGDQSVKQALECVQQAFEAYSCHPRVLNELANHFFWRREYDDVRTLCQRAMELSTSLQIKAESANYIARAYHAEGKFADALKYYRMSVQHYELNPIGLLGEARCMLYYRNYPGAIECLLKVTARIPDNPEALKMLVLCYAHTQKMEKGLDLVHRLLERTPADPDAWQMLGRLSESKDLKQCLRAYRRARSLLIQQGDFVPPELHHNIGAVYAKLGDIKGARAALLKALLAGEEKGQSGGKKEKKNPSLAVTEKVLSLAQIDGKFSVPPQLQASLYKVRNISTTFNLARLHEDVGKLDEAVEMYRGILREHPNYVDCYLRLSSVAHARGRLLEAGEWLQEALTLDAKNTDAWCMLGRLHMEKREWMQAQRRFEQVLNLKPNDPYAMVCLGNIYYEASGVQVKEETKRRYVKSGHRYFLTVLRANPRNLYAANGYAITLAERNLLSSAQDLFTRIRESVPNFSDAWVNLGHVQLAKSQLRSAITMYDRCLHRFYAPAVIHQEIKKEVAEENSAEEESSVSAMDTRENATKSKGQPELTLKEESKQAEAAADSTTASDASSLVKETTLKAAPIMHALSRAFYEAKQFAECRKVNARLVERLPDDLTARYNFALAKQEHAHAVLTGTNRQLKEVEDALEELKSAQKEFEQLAQEKPSGMEKARAYSVQKAAKHAAYCSNALKHAETHLSEAVQEDKKRQEFSKKLKETSQQVQEQMAARERAKRERVEAEQRRVAEMAAEAKRVAEETMRQQEMELERERERRRQEEEAKRKARASREEGAKRKAEERKNAGGKRTRRKKKETLNLNELAQFAQRTAAGESNDEELLFSDEEEDGALSLEKNQEGSDRKRKRGTEPTLEEQVTPQSTHTPHEDGKSQDNVPLKRSRQQDNDDLNEKEDSDSDASAKHALADLISKRQGKSEDQTSVPVVEKMKIDPSSQDDGEDEILLEDEDE